MCFETLYNRLSPTLKKIARSYNGRSHFIDGDDLYQEMSLHLWNNFRDGAPAELNDAYIIQSCKYHIFNYLRKNSQKAIILSLEETINEEGATLRDVLTLPEESLDDSVNRKMLFDEIRNNGFSKREKEVLTHLLAGLTVREIGKRLEISHVMVIKHKKNLIRKWQRKNRGYQNRQIFT